MVFSPASRAHAQTCFARGPGPETEMEYSPTFVSTPPRCTGASHSLTLRQPTSFGNNGIVRRASSMPQPQSHEITSAELLDLRTPSRKILINSAITSQLLRFEHRGQSPAFCRPSPHVPPCEKQFL